MAVDNTGPSNKTTYINGVPMHGGGGGGGNMETSVPIKDYIDARDDAVESRLSTSLDKLPTKATIWGAAGTLFGLLLAVAAFAGDRFDGGMGASSLMAEQAQAQRQTDETQDAKLELMDQKLDILIQQTASN